MRHTALHLIFFFAASALRANETPSMGDLIVSPPPGHPAIVSDTNTIAFQIVLRLPLTPPPGVQQPAANKGWWVSLSRNSTLDVVNRRTEVIRYRLPLLRLRPVSGDIYRITVELPPWLPEGRYDVTIRGPGFQAARSQAVQKGDDVFLDVSSLVLPALSTKRRLPLFIPRGTPGIALRTDTGASIAPETVIPATLPDNGARLAVYPVLPGQSRRLSAHVVPSKPCRVSLDAQTLAPNETLDWRTLTVKAAVLPVSTVWNFGDGRYGQGTTVRHRFLLENRAKVRVTTYDRDAAACTHEREIIINPLHRSSGCGGGLIGQP